MPDPTTLESIQSKMDEFGVAFTEYRNASDERVKQIEEKGQASDELITKMATLEEKLQQYDAVKGEFDEVKGRMDAVEAAQQRPGKEGITKEEDPSKPFKSFGEQMQAVAKMADPEDRQVHPGFAQIKAATGLNERIPSDGGVLVQTDYSSQLLKRTYEIGAIASRVRRIPISANSNGLKIPTISESTRVDGSRYGGIRCYWTEEAGVKTASTPELGELELKLHKCAALVYATDEILQDAAALEALIMDIFPEEMSYTIENSFLRGSGAGQPLGILNAGSTVTVTARPGQAAATIIWENIVDMWSRLWARSQANAVWLINQDCFPQLATMAQAVGVGGVPVWIPAGGASGSPYSTLMGRPVIPVEYCSTVGTVGDIILVDWSTYLTIDKGGIESAKSIHVRFLYDESVFRFVYRVDGQPTWTSTLTPANGNNTLSPVVVLESRT